MSAEPGAGRARPEHGHDGQVVGRAAPVDQELVVQVGCLVTLRLVLHVYGEVFPMSLDLRSS